MSSNEPKIYTVKVFPCGTKEYYNQGGQLHREDGPAIEYANGGKYWFQNGQYHRIDGPALETKKGDKYWYINGKRHREDGPAVEMANGVKYWYINGNFLFQDEFNLRNNSCEGKLVEIDGKKYKLQSV